MCSLLHVKFSEPNLKRRITWLKLQRVKMRQKAKIGKKPEQKSPCKGKLITIVSKHCKSPATAAQEANHLAVLW